MSWNPYDHMPSLASFTLVSQDVEDGAKMPSRHASGLFGAGGEDVSPHLSWSGLPAEARSIVVTMLDPDLPSPTGFWHWAVVNIPVEAGELPTGAGSEGGEGLPEGALQLPNDARMSRYIGAAPNEGDEPHRYVIAAHALDVPAVELPAEATPAMLNVTMIGRAVARALLVPWYQR